MVTGKLNEMHFPSSAVSLCATDWTDLNLMDFFSFFPFFLKLFFPFFIRFKKSRKIEKNNLQRKNNVYVFLLEWPCSELYAKGWNYYSTLHSV